MDEKLELEVGKLYKLNAQWHNRHGETVEIVMKRDSITKAYYGREIFHVAYNPLNPDARSEDMDTEYIADNFKECRLDDDVELFDINEFFEDLPQDLIDNINKIRDDEGLNSYVFLHDGFLEVTFGEDEDQARQQAFNYMVLKNKINEDGEVDDEPIKEALNEKLDENNQEVSED